jgi:predicted 3-demethylubiquinone-9 3-methyltransferase (glyoxalase superfamily)
MATMQKIVTNLWFDTEAEEAAHFYTSIFKDSHIENVLHYGDSGPREAGLVLTVDFTLEGQRFTAINGGPHFTFTEAISLAVNCETQDEMDDLWEKLSADGGEPGVCGWLKDKYGLSWQVVPTVLEEMLAREDHNSAKFNSVMKAMLKMTKLDIAELEKAYDEPSSA